MAATFSWVEYTAASTTATPTSFNLGSTNAANLSPSTYPISAGSYSYEKWIKGRFTGSFTSVDNLIFWKSDGDYVTGETMKYTGQATTFATPINTVSTNATTAVPITEPATANVSIGESLTGSLTATGDSDFIVLQASVTSYASSGASNQKTFSFSYDET